MAPRRLRWWERLGGRAVASRPGAWFYVNVAPHIDRALQRASGGRLSTAPGQQIGVLETAGARSGALRRTPLVYVREGERIVLIASRGGDARHPAWFHNLRANPEVRMSIRGRTRSYRAREAEGEERERLWRAAVDYYPGYATYQGRAGARRIPVVVLEPAGER